MHAVTPIQQYFNTRATLAHLRLVAALADWGQQNKAAAVLNVSAPAISKQMSELEAALGEQVFTRAGGKLQFTPAGMLLLACARQVLAQLDRSKTEMLEICTNIGGTLAIGAVPSIAPVMLPELILEFRRTAPIVSIRLFESRFDHLAQELVGGSLDVAIARYTDHPLSADFTVRKLCVDPLVVVIGSQHPLAATRVSNWKSLSGFQWIVPPTGTETFSQFSEILKVHGLPLPPGCVESTAFSTNINLLQRHPFLAIMPAGYARPYIESDRVRMLPLKTGMEEEIKAVFHKNNGNPLLEPLIACLAKVVDLSWGSAAKT